MKRVLILASVISLFFPSIRVSRAITLNECIRLAIKNRDIIKKHQFQIKSAKEKERSAMAGFLPSVDIEYGATRTRTRGSVDTSTFLGSGTGSKSRYAGIGLPGQNYTGGLNETTSSSWFSATVGLNLFRGFGDYRALRAARFSTSAEQYLLAAQKADVAFSVKKAYIEVLRTRSRLSVAKDAVRLLNKQLLDIKAMRHVGMATRRKVLKVLVELDSAEQELLTTKTSYKKAIDTLRRVVGIPYSREINVKQISFPNIDTSNFEKLKDSLLERRSEIRYYKALISSIEEKKKLAAAPYYPSLGLSLSYTKFGEDFNMETKDEGIDYESYLMITAKWNLFNGLRDYSHTKDTLYKELSTQRELQEVEHDLVLQLRHAIEDLEVARNKLNVAKEAVKEGKEHYRITYEAFKNGVATTTDVLDARYLLTRSQNEQINAYYDIELSLAALERILEKDNFGNVSPGKGDGTLSQVSFLKNR